MENDMSIYVQSRLDIISRRKPATQFVILVNLPQSARFSYPNTIRLETVRQLRNTSMRGSSSSPKSRELDPNSSLSARDK